MNQNFYKYLCCSIFIFFTYNYGFSQYSINDFKFKVNSQSWLSPGQPTIKNYKIWFKNREQIDNALWKMLTDSLKYNKKERWVELILRDKIVQQGDNRINELLRNNYIEDNWGIKGFLFYYEPAKIFYVLSVYNCSEFGIGCSLCIIKYFIDDDNHSLQNFDNKKERKNAIRTFKKDLLPVIKKKIRKMRKYHP